MDSPVNDTITAVPGLLIGHWTDAEAATGCTVVLCPEGAVASADVRGGAPGTRETDLLRPGTLVERGDAVLLAGGSRFGRGRADARPASAPGYAACEAASAAPPAMGSVGAGTGATVAKALGVERALKGGAGSAVERTEDGLAVGALVAVNCFGEVAGPESGRVVAGPRGEAGRFADTLEAPRARPPP